MSTEFSSFALLCTSEYVLTGTTLNGLFSQQQRPRGMLCLASVIPRQYSRPEVDSRLELFTCAYQQSDWICPLSLWTVTQYLCSVILEVFGFMSR